MCSDIVQAQADLVAPADQLAQREAMADAATRVGYTRYINDRSHVHVLQIDAFKHFLSIPAHRVAWNDFVTAGGALRKHATLTHSGLMSGMMRLAERSAITSLFKGKKREDGRPPILKTWGISAHPTSDAPGEYNM